MEPLPHPRAIVSRPTISGGLGSRRAARAKKKGHTPVAFCLSSSGALCLLLYGGLIPCEAVLLFSVELLGLIRSQHTYTLLSGYKPCNLALYIICVRAVNLFLAKKCAGNRHSCGIFARTKGHALSRPQDAGPYLFKRTMRKNFSPANRGRMGPFAGVPGRFPSWGGGVPAPPFLGNLWKKRFSAR